MERLTTKCSTILIAVGDQTQVYHSIEDIPGELRERLLASTRGDSAATILIADRGGREEILRTIRRSRMNHYERLAAAMAASPPPRQWQRPRHRWLPGAARLLLALSAGALLWLAVSLR